MSYTDNKQTKRKQSFVSDDRHMYKQTKVKVCNKEDIMEERRRDT